MAFQNVFVVGESGKVGQELIGQIAMLDGAHKWHLNQTRIIGGATSSRFWVSPEGVRQNNTKDYLDHGEILDAIRKSWLEWEVVFVDVTAEWPKMLSFHQQVIRDTTNSIVTANKKPLVGPMDVFRELTKNPRRYRYDASVMAGAPAVMRLQQAHGTGEEIIKIQWALSGTLAYICSELEKWEKLFSEIVREAKEKGYTEPHPLDDLSGEDVRRKLVILLRSGGVSIEESEIDLEGMVDASQYADLSPEEFLDRIQDEDKKFADRVAAAKSEWLVPRYIAVYDGDVDCPVISVKLKFVPKDSEFGMLKGTANKVVISTSQMTPDEDNPDVFQSPGAGVVKTANAVRTGILGLIDQPNLWAHN